MKEALYFEKILIQEILIVETNNLAQHTFFFKQRILNQEKGTDFQECVAQLLKSCQCSKIRLGKCTA